MLSSRSTRLAATLLMALLFGWVVRAWRTSAPSPQPASPAVMRAPADEKSNNAFPDE